jgi:membrane associated rhomboid family serine protease
MFLLLPVKTDSPLRGVPWANWTIIGLNVLMFFVQATNLFDYSGWILNAQRPELHQFISYAFLHDGFWHIAGNMLFLYIFGNNICDRLGNVAYLAFYLAAAAFAGIGYAALYPAGLVVGASGAVSAVTGAYLALLPRSHVTLFYWLFIMIGLYEIPSLWLIVAFFAVDVYSSFSRDTGVAHAAHIAGSVFGFIICMLLLKLRLLPRDHYDMLSLLDRWNRRRQYQQVIRQGYDPFNYGVASQDKAPAPGNDLMDQIQDRRAEISEAIAHGNLPEAGNSYLKLKELDRGQTLSRGAQLDVANHFYTIGDYRNAAEAYELFMKAYGSSEHAGHVALMLGMAYGRHLNEPAKAREWLAAALKRLPFGRDQEIAQSELERLEQQDPAGG